MARILLGLILLIPLTSMGLWLSAHPGDVSASWLGYRISLSTTAAFVALTGFAVIVMVASVLLHGMFQWPYIHRLHNRLSRHEHGLEYITRGLSAFAMGDNAKARKELIRASRALPHTPLPHLLAAQANLQSRDLEKAKPHLFALLDHKATAYIGYKRLLEQSKLAGDVKEYRDLLDKARAQFPYDHWLAERFIAHAIAEQRYTQALSYVEGFHMRHALPRARRAELARSIRLSQTISLGSEHAGDYVAYLSHENTASAAAPYVARHSNEDDAPRHMRALLAAYKRHPQKPLRDAMLLVYTLLSDNARSRFSKRMNRMAKRHDDAAIFAAQLALQGELYHAASTQALHAFELRPTKEAASLAALCYQKLDQPSQSETWYQNALEAPRSDAWQCTVCGQQHRAWQFACNACESLDAIRFQDVQSSVETQGLTLAA